MSAERLPIVFFGHGSPMNALGGRYAETWAAMAEAMPRPRSILMISAHWFVEGVAVTAMEAPKTIHDFGGFPDELYRIRYPAPGDLALAVRVSGLIAPEPVAFDQDWGLDHGTWSVLMHAYPGADIPVVQLSIDRTRPPDFHFEIGRRLKPLRDEGVLIAGSGDVVHNLGAASRDGAPPHDWAERFDALVRHSLEAGPREALVDYPALGEDAMLSIPTPEHYLPMLYVLGASEADEPVRVYNDEIDLAAVSMMSAVIG
ncbi:MAG TPA: 4,5-DOPA dioxygenase extradiol [Caulobacteraceae bacterium]